MGWYSEGRKTAPATNTVMADTGVQEVETSGDVCVAAGSQGACVMVVEHVAQDGISVLHDQAFPLAANGFLEFEIKISVQPGERIRVRTLSAVGANLVAQVSLISNII